MRRPEDAVLRALAVEHVLELGTVGLEQLAIGRVGPTRASWFRRVRWRATLRTEVEGRRGIRLTSIWAPGLTT
jgi:hypothetical protein